MSTPKEELSEAGTKMLDIIAALADANHSCPLDSQLRERLGKSTSLESLAYAGHIVIEVFRENQRVVTILSGPHAGKQTKRPPGVPDKMLPYRTIDTNGGGSAVDRFVPKPASSVTLPVIPDWERD